MGNSMPVLVRASKGSSEFPAELLNTAPQCLSGTSLLLNATEHILISAGFQYQVPPPCLHQVHLPNSAPGATPQLARKKTL